jgi:hypothetical protein
MLQVSYSLSSYHCLRCRRRRPHGRRTCPSAAVAHDICVLDSVAVFRRSAHEASRTLASSTRPTRLRFHRLWAQAQTRCRYAKSACSRRHSSHSSPRPTTRRLSTLRCTCGSARRRHPPPASRAGRSLLRCSQILSTRTVRTCPWLTAIALTGTYSARRHVCVPWPGSSTRPLRPPFLRLVRKPRRPSRPGRLPDAPTGAAPAFPHVLA